MAAARKDTNKPSAVPARQVSGAIKEAVGIITGDLSIQRAGALEKSSDGSDKPTGTTQ